MWDTRQQGVDPAPQSSVHHFEGFDCKLDNADTQHDKQDQFEGKSFDRLCEISIHKPDTWCNWEDQIVNGKQKRKQPTLCSPANTKGGLYNGNTKFAIANHNHKVHIVDKSHAKIDHQLGDTALL